MSVKSKETLTTTGKVRSALADCLERVSRGELSANDAKAIIGMANQITTSIAVELKHQNLQSQLGLQVKTLGALNIGDGGDE